MATWKARRGDLLAVAALAALALYLLHPLLGCLDSCFIDYAALHGKTLGSFALPDVRLNAWILAWDLHAAGTAPDTLFQSNCFFPAARALTGSEHLLGIAALLLPARIAGGGAIFLHQVALALSFLLLGLTTFALTRWLTGSAWAGFAAGAMAMAMPWRIFETSHVQLLSLQWFPLIWLLLARQLTGEGGWRNTIGLSIVISIQILSSFYLAYFLLLSAGILVAVFRLQRPIARTGALRLLVALLLPSSLLGLVALPYLESAWSDALVAGPSPDFRTGLGGAWSMIAPKLALIAPPSAEVGISYYLPLLPALLAGGALAALLRRAGTGVYAERIRVLGLCFGAMAVGAFVMMMGPELTWGAHSLKLPAHWAARWLPGFDRLRAPFRWGSSIGVLCPVLAGVGLLWLESALGMSRPGAAGRMWRPVWRALAALLLALNLPLRALPATPAWRDDPEILAAHRGLAGLAPGPVLELPWPIEPIPGSLRFASLYTLGSALHWRPMLNGFTGHKPRVSVYLRRIAQGLPSETALTSLRRLTGLRWIVVHTDLLLEAERRRWHDLIASQRLRVALRVGDALILEVPDAADAGTWMEALVSKTPRSRTFSGLSRAPLPEGSRGGELRATISGPFRFVAGELGRWPFPEPVALEIHNEGTAPWPGLDFDPTGLVQLRATFRHPDGTIAARDHFPLDLDVPGGEHVATRALVRGPTEAGRYRLTLDLVQNVGDEALPLSVAGVDAEVEARPLDAD